MLDGEDPARKVIFEGMVSGNLEYYGVKGEKIKGFGPLLND